jgi:hypothetical protein
MYLFEHVKNQCGKEINIVLLARASSECTRTKFKQYSMIVEVLQFFEVRYFVFSPISTVQYSSISEV